MRTITTDQLTDLQKVISNIRNICILAHVDHGKTTLADALVARNGVISTRMAGKMRYMDSRKDEQERGITMKSSAIALHHLSNLGDNYLINLIDSPGHVDFSSEVSTAVRLCDGALIVVDVVEGVCPQTKFAIRQAWTENLTPILVLNKIDRLITEKKMTPIDAHVHLVQVLEQTNAVMGELFATNVFEKATQESEMQKDNKTSEESTPSSDQIYDWDYVLDDSDDSNLYFTPEHGNVIFSSAYDRWGFSLSQFADLYSKKLGIQKKVLMKTLWGDYYVNMKAKKIMKDAQAKAKKPLFVQFILENIWKVYETSLERKDKEGMQKMCETLNVKVQARDMRHTDPRVFLQAMFSEWLPLGQAVLEMVTEILPSPNQISKEKIEKLMYSKAYNFDSLPSETQSLKKDFLDCCPDPDRTVIAYISKMFPIEVDLLPQNKFKPLTAEEMAKRREEARIRLQQKQKEKEDDCDGSKLDDSTPLIDKEEIEEIPKQKHCLIAFARIFSGTIKKGQRLYVLGPKHNPAVALEQMKNGMEVNEKKTLKDLKNDEHITSFIVSDLYMLMGREVENVEHVGAGNVFGIGGLEDHVLKTATISNTIACQSFIPLNIEAKPIVRVALEPKQSSDMNALVNGLKLLNQADACVEVYVQETGEHVLVTAGEVHLQRCIDDLKFSYANIDMNVSAPIVPFRETIIAPPKIDMVNEVIVNQSQTVKSSNQDSAEPQQTKSITVHTPDKRCVMTIEARPLPKPVIQLLEDNVEILRIQDQWTQNMASHAKNFEFNIETVNSLQKLKADLKIAFNESDSEWANVEDKIWSFGPKRCGANILLNSTGDYHGYSVWWDQRSAQPLPGDSRGLYDNSFINGFQMASVAGPLCEDPMTGVCFSVKEWKILETANSAASDASNRFGPLSGMIMAVVKDCCRQAFQAQPQRLVAAMYSCNIQATADVLGKLCGVISKRGGRVLHGDMQEGSQMFNVEALLPVVESFNLASEIRKQTSGLANPQLVFSHWEVLDTDPFWVPTTAEEYLHFGDKADSENRAAKYVNSVRKRKGLAVAEQIVEHAEKQRTLTKNK